jgi:hypothetical protein
VRRTFALLLLGAGVLATPRGEVLREEDFNYRIIGELPPGWKRAERGTAFSFTLDGIPHAHVHLVRQRISNELDVEEQVRSRVSAYRFPDVPAEVVEKIGRTRWAGREAVLYEHRVEAKGVLCRRRVTALHAKSVWYELIETVYGTETDERCREGLEVFRKGFRLLTEPLPKGAGLETAKKEITSREMGYRLLKPAGYHVIEVDTAEDPGCRVAFERNWPPGNRHTRVRLFEYGERNGFDSDAWFGAFFRPFSFRHKETRREKVEAPPIPGAREVFAERFVGRRGKLTVSTLIVLARSMRGRVYALFVRTQEGAPTLEPLRLSLD